MASVSSRITQKIFEQALDSSNQKVLWAVRTLLHEKLRMWKEYFQFFKAKEIFLQDFVCFSFSFTIREIRKQSSEYIGLISYCRKGDKDWWEKKYFPRSWG